MKTITYVILACATMLCLGLLYSKQEEMRGMAKPSISEFTVINQSSKASPAGVFANAVKNSIDGKWYQSASCDDAKRIFDTTPNAIMVYNSSVAFAARNKGIEGCQLDQVKTLPIMVAKTYMSICRLPETTAPLGGTLGMASMYAVPKHEKQWNEGTKLVPYSGSKTVLQALRAGDIQWGWMGSGLARKQGKRIVCPYSTNPAHNTALASPTLQWLGNAVPTLTIADFSINIVVYTNTMNVDRIRNHIKRDLQFQTFLKSSGYQFDFTPSRESVKAIDSFVDTMVKTWM